MTSMRAMARGSQVVSTPSGAIPERAPAAGDVLLPERGPDALAKAIVQLLYDERWVRLAGPMSLITEKRGPTRREQKRSSRSAV